MEKATSALKILPFVKFFSIFLPQASVHQNSFLFISFLSINSSHTNEQKKRHSPHLSHTVFPLKNKMPLFLLSCVLFKCLSNRTKQLHLLFYSCADCLCAGS